MEFYDTGEDCNPQGHLLMLFPTCLNDVLSWLTSNPTVPSNLAKLLMLY